MTKVYKLSDLNDDQLAVLVKGFQRNYHLNDDGIIGPMTMSLLTSLQKPDGRYVFKPFGDSKAYVTSKFKSDNHKRPKHNGVDFFRKWEPGMPTLIGDGGGAGRDSEGNPVWCVPPGTQVELPLVLRSRDDLHVLVQRSVHFRNTPTGIFLWAQYTPPKLPSRLAQAVPSHLWLGFAHLVDVVTTGTTYLMTLGHNPKDTDAIHGHMEVATGEADPRTDYPNRVVNPLDYFVIE